jgi:hypothetical protein
MSINNFYILVDTEKKITIGKIESLPEYWNNISGLSNFTDEQLRDLSWAGNTGLGFVKLNSEDLQTYSSSEENLNLNKSALKTLVSNLKSGKKGEYITFNDVKIPVDDTTRYSILIKKLQALKDESLTFNFKCFGSYFTFTSLQMIEVSDIIEEYIQSLYDKEMEIFNQIDSCETMSDFLNIDYDL